MPRRNGKGPSAGEYAVGYGRPPQHTRFKPGQSGNPAGKRKPRESIDTMIARLQRDKVRVTVQGHEKWLTKLEVMFITITNNAAKGDLRAAEFLLRTQKAYAASAAYGGDHMDQTAQDRAILERYLRSHMTGPADGVTAVGAEPDSNDDTANAAAEAPAALDVVVQSDSDGGSGEPS
jgi:hypothetical protein